jgi:thioredoxin-like negative regulator of GroEL
MKLDVDANPVSADLCKVESYPTCILFKAGEEVERLDGYMPLRKIESALQPYFED